MFISIRQFRISPLSSKNVFLTIYLFSLFEMYLFIAVIMLLITCVLINNTVHLSIYSRRFSIHTMQLVGATNGFIRRPIVLDNLLCGLISGVLASGVTALAMWGARESGVVDVATFLSWRDFGFVGAGMMLAGVLMCVVSSWLSATHYLHKEYDELFR